MRPGGLFIERAGVLHPVEPVAVVEGVMQNPSGSLVVAWYHQLAAVGEGDNVVMAGNSGTVGVRPGVFTRLRELAPGDLIEVLTADGTLHPYAVVSVDAYAEAADVPLQEVVGRTPVESLTLISGLGVPDDPVVIVRAEAVPAGATPVAGTPSP